MTTITNARQENAVSEGIALGMVVLGRSTLDPFNKGSVDLTFARAWRSWRYAGTFPRVTYNLQYGNGWRVMTRADRAKSTRTLFWDVRAVAIQVRDGVDLADQGDLELAADLIDGDVPLDGWADLAKKFLDDYFPDGTN